LGGFLQKRGEKLGISPDELEARFKELVSLEEEIASKRSEKNTLGGEIEALSERHEKLSSHMEKASFDFQRDIKLIRDMRGELAQIGEMKGRYAREAEDMEWAEQILPFLRYPDKVEDPDFKLASTVVSCIDKWLPTQNLGFPWQVKWSDITKHAQSKRIQLR
jgi:predicted RNase H-like nuclease (RuvC/YqgF family)